MSKGFCYRGVLATLLVFCVSSLAAAQGGPPPPPPLPPVPVPPENPITEAKRFLGKILFWDEQLSGDDTVACGTCHSNGSSGTDNRIGINPGPNVLFGDADDVRGSAGVRHTDVTGNPVLDAIFGFGIQVTGRSANATLIAAYSPELFWDGRARSTFVDPQTGAISILDGGALENQAVGPILSTVEMGRDNRQWSHVAAKLASSEPLGHATAVPADILPLLAAHPTYGDLFEAAFGDPTVTAERIAMAIATYERTLVPNQTPWDRFVAGIPGAMTPGQTAGWNFFRGSPCAACHTPPTFSNFTYRNIGVRPPAEDPGRRDVTGLPADRGRFKVPTLRGVGLKSTFMHNGAFNNLPAVIAHYAPGNPAIFLDNIDPILPVGVPPPVQPALIDFMANALTDPRVAAQTFPFDQPTLHAGALQQLAFDADKTTMRWPALSGIPTYVMYRGDVADLADFNADGLPDFGYGDCVTGSDPNPADTLFIDAEMPEAGQGFYYVKGVRDGAGIRGLGVGSTVRPRVPASECP